MTCSDPQAQDPQAQRPQQPPPQPQHASRVSGSSAGRCSPIIRRFWPRSFNRVPRSRVHNRQVAGIREGLTCPKRECFLRSQSEEEGCGGLRHLETARVRGVAARIVICVLVAHAGPCLFCGWVCLLLGLGFGVWDLGCGVWGLGFGIWGLRFGVWGFEVFRFRVSGLGLGILGLR